MCPVLVPSISISHSLKFCLHSMLFQSHILNFSSSLNTLVPQLLIFNIFSSLTIVTGQPLQDKIHKFCTFLMASLRALYRESHNRCFVLTKYSSNVENPVTISANRLEIRQIKKQNHFKTSKLSLDLQAGLKVLMLILNILFLKIFCINEG